LAFAAHLLKSSKPETPSNPGGFGSGMTKNSLSALPRKTHGENPAPAIQNETAPLFSAAGAEEIVWRGILRRVVYHQPAGVPKKDGSMGSGWGIFAIEPVAPNHQPDDMPLDPVIHAKKSWTVKGVLTGDPQEGMEILCHGKIVNDPRYGQQIEASVLVEPLPNVRDLEHIQRWLTRKTGASKHRIVGMTPTRAKKAIAHFGEDILNAMADPERLKEIFPEKICLAMAESFQRESRSYRLHLFFLDHALHQGHVHAVLSHLEELYRDKGTAWTVDAVVARTRENPYWLTEVSGIGFSVADRLAGSLGMAEDDPVRLLAGLRYALDLREKDGHTVTQDDALLRLAGGKNVLRTDSMSDPEKAEQKLKDVFLQWVSPSANSSDVLCWDIPSKDGFSMQRWVTRAVCGYSERYVARRILELSTSGQRMLSAEALQAERGHGVMLSGSQMAALLQCCSASFGVLTGGPGTGKTTCLNTVAHAALACGLHVELCAPSGKAASRLGQATGLGGKTIHRLLGLGPDGDAHYNRDNPYPADLFIVDESSMVDVYLMMRLLYAIPDGAGVLLVGDDQQLPSVGPGRVFGDIIDSGVVPVGRLTENHRQGGASDVAVAAARVVSGRLPCAVPAEANSNAAIPQETSFFSPRWVEHGDGKFVLTPERVIQSVRDDIDALVRNGARAEDIQILSPQKTGPMGISAMNREMTTILNPLRNPAAGDGLDLWPEVCRTPLEMGVSDDQPMFWHVGDRVIQVKNDYQNGVFNGDMGVIVWTEPESEDQKPLLGVYFQYGDLPDIAQFMAEAARQGKPLSSWALSDMQAFGEKCSQMNDGKIVWYDIGQISRVRPAGVLTIHKTQGSEYAYVIMILHTHHWFMASRPLLYTGMTRAKKGLRLYISEKSARKAVRDTGATRDTLLSYRLKTGWIETGAGPVSAFDTNNQ
jgi:exodeoxyribonuclease V alpha subunit